MDCLRLWKLQIVLSLHKNCKFFRWKTCSSGQQLTTAFLTFRRAVLSTSTFHEDRECEMDPDTQLDTIDQKIFSCVPSRTYARSLPHEIFQTDYIEKKIVCVNRKKGPRIDPSHIICMKIVKNMADISHFSHFGVLYLSLLKLYRISERVVHQVSFRNCLWKVNYLGWDNCFWRKRFSSALRSLAWMSSFIVNFMFDP